MNEKSLKLIKENFDNQPFKYQMDGFRSISKKVPEFAVAYEEEYIKNLYEKNGLKIIEPRYGGWPGKEKLGGYGQDTVLAIKI